jgi:ABC-type uncharacterized transport system auxiliary subunit
MPDLFRGVEIEELETVYPDDRGVDRVFRIGEEETMKRKFRIGFFGIAGVMLIFFAASVWAAYDMAVDPRVYQYSNHKAKKQYPVALQVKVIKDLRPEQEKVQRDDEHPYTFDALWSGLVDEMLAKVLEREFSESGMVTSVDPKNEQASYVLLIELNSFHGRWAPVPRSFRPIYDIYGNTEFSARLVSRKTDRTLFKKNYVGRSKTQASQFRNKYGFCAIEAGKAFREAAVKLMTDVEIALSGGKVSEY